MKKRYMVIIVIIVILAAAGVYLNDRFCFPGEAQAKRRVLELTELVNYHYDKPEQIYRYLTEDYRKSITKEDFVAAFVKERSYPYLTPFFINYESITMDEGMRSGVADFSQAARIGGMFYKIPFVYENGNYYMTMEEYAGFPDGSFLKKFDSIPKYLIEGWGN